MSFQRPLLICVTWQKKHWKDPSSCLQSRPWRVDLELRGNQLITGTWYIIFTCQGKKGRKKKMRVKRKGEKAGFCRFADSVWEGQEKNPGNHRGWGHCPLNASLHWTLDAFKQLLTCPEPAFISHTPQTPFCALHVANPRHLLLTCSQWPHLLFHKNSETVWQKVPQHSAPKSTYYPVFHLSSFPQVIKKVLIPHLGHLLSSCLLWNLTYQFSSHFPVFLTRLFKFLSISI